MNPSVRTTLLNIIRLRSLQARIFVIILVVGILPSVVMRYGIVDNYEERSVLNRVTTVQNQLLIIANHLISNNYLTSSSNQETILSASRAVIDAELDTIATLYDGRVQVINSNLKIITDTYDINDGKTIVSEEVIQCFRTGTPSSFYDAANGYIEMLTPILDNSVLSSTQTTSIPTTKGVLLTSISTNLIDTTMQLLNRQAMIVETIMVVAIIGIAYFLSIAMAKPFHRITQAINEVKAGYESDAISVPDYAETIQIVEAFNHMLVRMKVLDDSRQEFVANVSHELKTPLASMKVLADSLLTQGTAPIEIYKEFLEDIVSEIDRENQIITDLLALVRMDKRAQKLNITMVDMNHLTELILKRLRPIARKKNVDVTFESIRTVSAAVDEVKMTLIITNLVDNAIKYNKEQGSVTVLLDADHQSFLFEVQDTGIGIPEEDLAHIYERFYRVEKSHSKEIGGTGLGLAITKSAVLMHRGTITVTSTVGEGSRFSIRIPLNYIDPSRNER
ncbi:MAG: ATP-binding protein [Lachnospiraceae bacterium]|jgi:signal transduction histidine kinase|nr:ATP-binding protein [Lachnospiraceae bacterium]